jgi:mono/diheme cytochrome c family protein
MSTASACSGEVAAGSPKRTCATIKLLAALLVVLGAGAALAESPNLGRPISDAEIKAWDITVLPNGEGLPAGQGTPAGGAKIYAEKCAMCHGEGGRGGPGGRPLVGGAPLTDGIDTHKTIKNYFAYSTTIFDEIRRAMPYNAPKSLSDNEVYALTAYLLSLNKLIGDNDVMDAKTLPQVKMPNRDNFTLPYPDRI